MKNPIPTSYDSNSVQVLKETSWLVIDNSTSNDLRIKFFNNDEIPENQRFDSFKDFVQDYLDNEFEFTQKDNVQIKEDRACASASTASEEEDFDEETGRTWKVYEGKGQIIDAFKGFKMENLDKLIKESHHNLKMVVGEACEQQADSDLYHKDPYAYHGVSKKDFF